MLIILPVIVYILKHTEFYNISAFDQWEQGSINPENGILKEDNSKIRSDNYISIPSSAI